MSTAEAQNSGPRASQRLPWVTSPLLKSAALSHAAGCQVLLKLENVQPSGSFKSRGLGNLIVNSLRPDGRPVRFYTSSGGNAGLAAVIAARAAGQECGVVVPNSTKPEMIARIRAEGATSVIQTGDSWSQADSHLREVVLKEDKDGVYMPPFDHPLVWAGNETIVDEIKDQMPSGEEPDAIICSVGGGGLFAGIAQGVEKHYGGRTKVLAVETIGCDSLSQSLKAGERITLPKITSLATSLGAIRVAERPFELAQRSNVTSVTVTDAEAAMGSWRFADDHRMLVELACGASLAFAYNDKLKELIPNFSPESKVVFVVCGGTNISLAQLMEYRELFGMVGEQQATKSELVPSTATAPK